MLNKAKFPPSRDPVRATDKKPSPKKTLVSSPAEAERDIEGLRRGQEARDAAPTEAQISIRASLI